MTRDQAIEIARSAATRTADEPFHEYQPTPETARDWMPHEWVIDAVLAAGHTGGSDIRKAAQAVEAWWLEQVAADKVDGAPYCIFALRAALAQPEPEPPTLADVLDALNVFNPMEGAEQWVESDDIAVKALPKFIHSVGKAWYLAPSAQPEQQAPATLSKEQIGDIVREHLRGLYHCGRVWEAWSVGTMSEDDFSPAEELETADEIADSLLVAMTQRQGAQPEQQAADWTEPTSYYQRMSDAITLLCAGKRPPEKMVFSWIDSTSEELQEFCIEHGPGWAQGIVLIDAARVMADTPTEGVDHEAHPPAQPDPKEFDADDMQEQWTAGFNAGRAQPDQQAALCPQVNSGVRCNTPRKEGERVCPDCNPQIPGRKTPQAIWPFVESPGAFTARLADALGEFGTLLAAVRYVLIEKPPTMIESSAERTLKHLGYTDCGGEYWEPPLGKLSRPKPLDPAPAEMPPTQNEIDCKEEPK